MLRSLTITFFFNSKWLLIHNIFYGFHLDVGPTFLYISFYFIDRKSPVQPIKIVTPMYGMCLYTRIWYIRELFKMNKRLKKMTKWNNWKRCWICFLKLQGQWRLCCLLAGLSDGSYSMFIDAFICWMNWAWMVGLVDWPRERERGGGKAPCYAFCFKNTS
jgi:hypothetical protein